MRRWLLIALFSVVLPFQFAWAAAAPVCAHEARLDSQKHFGHHEHQHLGADPITAGADDGERAAGLNHADCESCQLGTSASPLSPQVVIAFLPAHAPPVEAARAYRSHVPFGPERPDRFELTAAVRSGSGVEFRSLPS